MTFFYDLNKKLAGIVQPEQLTEGKKAKPDFLDLDDDGNKKETMKQAAKDAAKKIKESGDVMDEQWMTEKFDQKVEINPAKKGMFKGKTKAELQKQLSKLKASGPHEKGSAAYTKMKELQFAIRAKSGWGKVDEAMTDGDQFVDYVMSFYGPGGVYDMGVSKDDVAKAIEMYKKTSDIPFDGDSVDRENVRDILIDKFGYEWVSEDIAVGTDFDQSKEEKVKLKTNRGVEPGADLDEEAQSKTDDALRNFYKKQKAEKMKRAGGKRDYYEADVTGLGDSKYDDMSEDAEPVEYNDDKNAYNGMTFESVTRKHFQQVADLLTHIDDLEKRRELAQHHADIFSAQNPRFDQQRFFKAVGLNESMKIGDTRKSSTGGTIEKIKGGIKHTAKAYDPDAEEVDAPKRKRGGQAKDFGKKEYTFAKDEKALAAHKKQPKGKVHAMKEEELDEKSVSQAQQKAAGIALAAKRAGKKLKGDSASASMEKMPTKELEKFASTKHKGLPKKVKEESTSYPDDVPTVGDRQSVSKPGKSMGITYGKGVYEAFDAELEAKIKQLNESVEVKTAIAEHAADGDAESITITASGADVGLLKDLLKNAGLNIDGIADSEAFCAGCGCAPCECSDAGNEGDLVAFELAEADVDVSENNPDYPTNGEESDDALQYSGGLNGPKSTGQTTVPVIASQLRRQATMEDAAETDSFLNLFKVFKNIVK